MFSAREHAPGVDVTAEARRHGDCVSSALNLQLFTVEGSPRGEPERRRARPCKEARKHERERVRGVHFRLPDRNEPEAELAQCRRSSRPHDLRELPFAMDLRSRRIQGDSADLDNLHIALALRFPAGRLQVEYNQPGGRAMPDRLVNLTKLFGAALLQFTLSPSGSGYRQ